MFPLPIRNVFLKPNCSILFSIAMHCLDLGTNLRSFLLSYCIRIDITKMVDNTNDFILFSYGWVLLFPSRVDFLLAWD
jgi:hypothetical protein